MKIAATFNPGIDGQYTLDLGNYSVKRNTLEASYTGPQGEIVQFKFIFIDSIEYLERGRVVAANQLDAGKGVLAYGRVVNLEIVHR